VTKLANDFQQTPVSAPPFTINYRYVSRENFPDVYSKTLTQLYVFSIIDDNRQNEATPPSSSNAKTTTKTTRKGKQKQTTHRNSTTAKKRKLKQ